MAIKYSNRYWRTIRASHEVDGLSLVELAIKYKPSRIAIYNRSRKEGWLRGIIEASAKHNVVIAAKMATLNQEMIDVKKYPKQYKEEFNYQAELMHTRNKNNYLNAVNQGKLIENTGTLIENFNEEDKFAIQKNKALADTSKSLHSEDKSASTQINVNTQVNIHNYDNYSDDELEKEIIELEARLKNV